MAEIIARQSKFQEISIVADPLRAGGHILYLDHMWQYNSILEYRYHEGIASLPAICAEGLDNVLICGGGDGLAVRELLRFKEVKTIDLVEIDEEMIKLFKTEPLLTRQNQKSLSDERVKVNVMDAREFIRNNKTKYDLVILDFPSPGSDNRHQEYYNLYSVENIAHYVSAMKPWGVLSSQTSIANTVLVPLIRFLLEKRFYAWSYDIYYDGANSHDSFTVACKNRLSKRRSLPPSLRFITEAHIKAGFSDSTEVTKDDLVYYSLFEHAEITEAEVDYLG